MNVFNLEAVVSLNADDFEKGIKQASANFDKVVAGVSSASESIDKLSVPMSKYKSDVMKLASEYKKSGMEQSEAVKKAYADTKKSYEEQGIVVEKTNKKISDSNEDVGESTENESEKIKKSHKKIKDSQRTTSEESEKSSKKFASNWDNAAASIEKMSDRIKTALATITKISAAAVGAASTGLGAIIKQSVESYASYEQLIGGVETLFGDSAYRIKKYADEAYTNAGMSANEYMETVTGFSASLLQGLGGNTAEAAEIANQAIIDMSDNANKMGTDMESIKNAYQGFAKQNYTMLDNLKLGYGGTNAEMARLINDSGVLAGVMEVTADTVNDVSFDKIIEAINVVQTEMGITGTTAEEAATTIEGSVASMKSAWKNLMTEISKDDGDIPEKIDLLVSSSEVAFDRIYERIEKNLNGIGKLVEKAAPIISAKLPAIVRKILPSLLKSGAMLISSLSQALIKSIPGVVEDLIESVVEAFGLSSQWGKLKTKLSPIVESFTEIGGSIFNTVTEIAGTISETLGNIDFDKILESFSGILDSVKPTIETIGSVFSEISENVLAPLVTWAAENGIPAAFDLISSAVNALKSAIEYLQPIAEDIWDKFLKPLSEWAGDTIASMMEKLADAIDAIAGDETTVEHLTNIAIAIAGIKVTQSAITGILSLATGLKTLATNAKMAVSSMSLLGKIGAITGAAFVGWEIGSFLREKLNTDEILFEFFDNWFAGWESIKAFFSGVVEWFGEKINSIIGFFQGLPPNITNIFGTIGTGIKNFFEGIWTGIKNVFSGIGDWFKEKFDTAVEGIKEAFNGVKGFFEGIWTGIKDVFGGIKNWFKEKFDAVAEVIKSPLNSIIDAMNFVIRGLNKISIDIPDWVPDWAGGGKTFGFNINEIPHLAKGGIVDRPTIAEIGEAGKEAVIPLENNLGWIDKIAEKLKNVYPVSSGVIIENINVTVNGTEDMDIGREVAEKIAEKLEELQIIQQTAVGGTGWK